MQLRVLPENVQMICRQYDRELLKTLGDKLYGVYMYGAAVFEDAGRIRDIDCHVILRTSLTDGEREKIFALNKALAKQFPPLGGEIDAYYLLLEDTKRTSPPRNQLRPDICDESWSLHCAHVRAGYYITLHGPDPTDIFPPPSWRDIAAALDHEMRFIEENLEYPDYCVLNLCRIIYSFLERDVVVSKRFSGNWLCSRFPQWAPLVNSAIRSYEDAGTTEDDRLLYDEVENFLEFASDCIREVRDE